MELFKKYRAKSCGYIFFVLLAMTVSIDLGAMYTSVPKKRQSKQQTIVHQPESLGLDFDKWIDERKQQEQEDDERKQQEQEDAEKLRINAITENYLKKERANRLEQEKLLAEQKKQEELAQQEQQRLLVQQEQQKLLDQKAQNLLPWQRSIKTFSNQENWSSNGYPYADWFEGDLINSAVKAVNEANLPVKTLLSNFDDALVKKYGSGEALRAEEIKAIFIVGLRGRFFLKKDQNDLSEEAKTLHKEIEEREQKKLMMQQRERQLAQQQQQEELARRQKLAEQQKRLQENRKQKIEILKKKNTDWGKRINDILSESIRLVDFNKILSIPILRCADSAIRAIDAGNETVESIITDFNIALETRYKWRPDQESIVEQIEDMFIKGLVAKADEDMRQKMSDELKAARRKLQENKINV